MLANGITTLFSFCLPPNTTTLFLEHERNNQAHHHRQTDIRQHILPARVSLRFRLGRCARRARHAHHRGVRAHRRHRRARVSRGSSHAASRSFHGSHVGLCVLGQGGERFDGACFVCCGSSLWVKVVSRWWF